MKKLLLAEQVYVVLSLQFLAGAWVPTLYQITTGQSVGDAHEGNLVTQVFFYAIYAVTFALIFLRWKQFFYGITKGKLLLVLIGLALFSVLWSDAPEVTLRRSSAALGTTLFGTYLATRYNLKEQLHLLAWAFGTLALSSLLFTIAFPAYGINAAQGGAWRGIFLHKNPLGNMMTIGAIVFLLSATSSRKNRRLMWFGFGLSVCLLLLSTAKTPLVIFITLLLVLPLYRALRWNFSWMMLCFIAVVIVFGCLTILILGNWEMLLNAMGKDVTLTGRTGLWTAVLDMVQERPWLGYGYSGFWLGTDGEGSAYVLQLVGWPATYSHNGILDLLLDIGYIGLFVFLLSFVTSCFGAIALVRWTKTDNGFWPLMLLTFTLLSNVTDSTILRQNSIYWALYVAVTLSTSIWSAKDIQV